LDDVVRAIRVKDANGDELTLYEYRPAGSYLTMALNRGAPKRMALDTGEEAARIDDDTFVIVASGERLARIP
jgi:hypothetical protein